MTHETQDLVAKKGRPPTGRGAYFRIYLDKELTKTFDDACTDKGFTRSELLRIIVTSWLDKKP